MRRGQILSLAFVAFALAACASDAGPSNATRIETDQNTGAIRFIVNGQEQARIDASGMHVPQGVEAGTLTLTGPPAATKP